MNGQKRFIVGGEGADFFLVYAVTDPSVRPQEGITAFVVERGPGVKTKYLYGLMGCRGGGTARLVFRYVKVPRANIVGKLNGGYDVFNTMMIPERLGTAAMTIGAARPALEIATGYTSRRKAFGQVINRFQGVSFQVAEAAMLLDAARSWSTLLHAVDAKLTTTAASGGWSRRRKFVTESCQKVVHNSMQGTRRHRLHNILPVERIGPRHPPGLDLDRQQRGHVRDRGPDEVPEYYQKPPNRRATTPPTPRRPSPGRDHLRIAMSKQT